MKGLKVGFMLLLTCLIVVEVCESRGRSGGGRSGGRSSSRSRSRSSGSGSASKPKITKNTPITPKSRTTSVIRSQTKIGSRSNTARNILVGYVVYRYLFSSAPVYRRDYDMYGRRSVQIPEERAVRVLSTETKMVDHDNNLCLSELYWNDKQSVPADSYVVYENATIQYGSEEPVEFDGINQNFTLAEEEGVDFEIVSRTQYNATLVEGKNCFIVEENVKGTVIHLYETNPDGATTAVLNAWLSLLTAVLMAFLWSSNP